MAYERAKKSKKKMEPVPVADKYMIHVRDVVDTSSSNRGTWVNKQTKYNKLRMRIKKAKTFPFIGCSNIRMPTAEIKLRKLKAALYNVVFGIRPVVTVVPPPGGRYETAMKIEKFLDHLIWDVMEYPIKKGIITIDQELEQGFYLNSPYWRLEVTRRKEIFSLSDFTLDEVMFLYDGKTTDDMVKEFLTNFYDIDMNDKISDKNEEALDEVLSRIYENDFSFYVEDIVYDAPDVELFSPERCYVPSDSPMHPQDCQCLVLEYFLPYHVLKTNAEYFGWDIDGVSDIGSYRGKQHDKDFTREQNKDLQEGIERINGESELVRIWRYLGWYDLDGDGVDEKCIMHCAPDFQKTLHKHSLPFLNGKFNVVKFFYELTDNRWYAHRGIVEIAEDIIKEIDVQHNMKIDQQTIRNAPMFLYRAGQVNPNLIQMIPNQAIPIRGLQPLRDTVDVLNNTNPNAEFSYEREQQILESKLEELMGQVDYTLQSQINKREPRTLGEVQLQAQSAQNVFSLDASQHTHQFSELFTFIWDLWCQYGSDEYEFNYFGQNGWEPIKLSKEEIQGKYRVTVRGNDRNTNPQIRLQKASQIMSAAVDPVLIQSGVITPMQMINSLKRFYQYLEVENWEDLINMQWQPPQPPPPGADVQINTEDLVDGEAAQVLAGRGIQPDFQGRMMRSQMELLGKMIDDKGKFKEKGGGNGKAKTD